MVGAVDVEQELLIHGAASSVSAAALTGSTRMFQVRSAAADAPARLFPNRRIGNTVRGGEFLVERSVLRQRLHRGEQIARLTLGDIARDEHDAASSIGGWPRFRPGLQLDRRMGEM